MVGRERHAIVSCHAERLLDEIVWRRLTRLLERQPFGFAIAPLLRPPDATAREDPELWLERARRAAVLGPIGHHTHWGGAAQARPVDGEPAATVRQEGAWLRHAGLEPRLFCGGGWYIDQEVAAAVAELGYADCTGTSFRPAYLPAGAARLELERPCRLELPTGARLLELPTTHSLGTLIRAALRPGGLREPLVHLYFHDTDLLDPGRATALGAALALLACRRRPIALERALADAEAGYVRPF